MRWEGAGGLILYFGEPAKMSRLFVGYKLEVKNKVKEIDGELIPINWSWINNITKKNEINRIMEYNPENKTMACCITILKIDKEE